MRIATWNVNGLRARLAFVLQWLVARDPDLVGFQELKLTDDQFPHAEFEALGYRALTHGQKSWNGVAILSKLPLEQIEAGLPGQADFGARLLRARVGTGERALDFTTLYCPNGKDVDHDDYPRKLAWFESLREWASRFVRPDLHAVLCGDFNVVPTPLDSYSEEELAGSIFHTDDERRRYSALLALGLVDLFRVTDPETRAFSWWDYRGGAFHRRQGLRIDFLLGTPAIASRLRGVTIDRDWRKKKDELTPSDHAPVVAEIE